METNIKWNEGSYITKIEIVMYLYFFSLFTTLVHFYFYFNIKFLSCFQFQLISFVSFSCTNTITQYTMASGETKQPQEESRSEHTINTLRQELINVNNDIVTLADAIRDTLETRQWKTITGFPERLTKLESYKKKLELKLHKQEALPFVDLYELARTTYGANDEPNTTLIAFWRLIFEFKGTSEKDIRGLTYSCRLFKDVLRHKMKLFTTFPNPNYDVSFGVFMNVLNRNASLHPNNSPKWLFLANGVHEIEIYEAQDYNGDGVEVNYVQINIPISIIGESREYCIVIGGLKINGNTDDTLISEIEISESDSSDTEEEAEQKVIKSKIKQFTKKRRRATVKEVGKEKWKDFSFEERLCILEKNQMNRPEWWLVMEEKEDDVNVQDLTLRESKDDGVRGHEEAAFHLDNVSVENSGCNGVSVCTQRNTMKNCNVSHSKESGLLVYNGGLMTIDGNASAIHHNNTDGRSHCYGMEVFNYPSFSAIYLVSPLTKEMISTNNGGISRNNGGGLNYGGGGTIESVDDDSQVLVVVYEAKTN